MKYSCKKCGAELPADMTKECPCLSEKWPRLDPSSIEIGNSETISYVFVPSDGPPGRPYNSRRPPMVDGDTIMYSKMLKVSIDKYINDRAKRHARIHEMFRRALPALIADAKKIVGVKDADLE